MNFQHNYAIFVEKIVFRFKKMIFSEPFLSFVVFDLAQFGAIHPGDRFWVETDPATNLAVTDRNGDPFPPFNCSFVGFT